MSLKTYYIFTHLLIMSKPHDKTDIYDIKKARKAKQKTGEFVDPSLLVLIFFGSLAISAIMVGYFFCYMAFIFSYPGIILLSSLSTGRTNLKSQPTALNDVAHPLVCLRSRSAFLEGHRCRNGPRMRLNIRRYLTSLFLQQQRCLVYSFPKIKASIPPLIV